VGRPAATLQPQRPRLVRSLLSVRNWQQLGKFCVVGAVNYTWNRLWTFRELRGHFGVQGMRFFVVSLAALGANLLVLHVLIAQGGLGKLPAQAWAIVLVTPLNFVGNKLWSFRRRRV
jgi:putative flippase GtrA